MGTNLAFASIVGPLIQSAAVEWLLIMYVNFIEIFLKGLACLGTVGILLWITRWESMSYTASIRGGGGTSSLIFYIMKLFSRNDLSGFKNTRWLYVIVFVSLMGSFFPFAMFPLCGNIFWQGREIFTEYCRTEIGLALVLIGIILNHISVGIVKNYQEYHGQNMYVASRLACFISSIGTLLMILMSLFVTYESFDFHEIVKRQKSFFEYGLFLQPVAAILFLGCIQIEDNTKIFSVPEKNYYHGMGGIEFLFLRLLEKTRWLCLITIYAFVFLGGYSLIPGLERIVAFSPKFLQLGQFISLIFKISFVAFVAIIIKHSFLERRGVDIVRLSFGKIIPLAFINFVAMVGIKFT